MKSLAFPQYVLSMLPPVVRTRMLMVSTGRYNWPTFRYQSGRDFLMWQEEGVSGVVFQVGIENGAVITTRD